MKILVNRKIKRLFLCVLLWQLWRSFGFCSHYLSATELRGPLCDIGRRVDGAHHFAALYWYFRDQSKTMNEAIAQIREYITGDRNARIECDDEGDCTSCSMRSILWSRF